MGWFEDNAPAPATTDTSWFAKNAPAPTPAASASTSAGIQPPQRNYNRVVAGEMVRALPYVMGGIGGLTGGPLGAGLLGASGAGLEEFLAPYVGNPVAENVPSAVGGILKKGATQGALEVGGIGASKIAGGAARRLMRGAIRPTPSVQREFGDVVGTAVKERIPVGKGWDVKQRVRGPKSNVGMAGSEIAAKKVAESGKDLHGILAEAGKRGVTFTTRDLAMPVADLIRNVRRQPLKTKDMAAVRSMLDEFLASRNGKLGPQDVKALKQQAQAMAQSVFRAERMGNVIPAAQSLEARFNRAVATGAKRALETIPQVARTEARTKRLIGTQRAIQTAEGRQHAGGIPLLPPAINWMLPDFVRSPAMTSRASLLLTDPVIQAMLRQIPRGGMAGIQALTPEEEFVP